MRLEFKKNERILFACILIFLNFLFSLIYFCLIDAVPGEEAFEAMETPVSNLSEEIARRTHEKAGKDPNRVSDIPVFIFEK